MAWDISGFIKRLQGGFDSGEQKTADEEKLVQQQQKEQEKLQQQEDKVTKQDQDEARKSELHQLTLIEKLAKLFEPKQEKVVEGQPAPTPTPNPILEALKKGMETGFINYSAKSGYDNPLATMSAEMAQGAVNSNLPDPYLPATMNLMETGGSKNMASENNYFNYGSNPKPDAQTAIDRVYQGIGNTGDNGLYKDYLKTGNIGDFFKRYTPSSDPRNPNQEALIETYNKLRQYFPATE